MHARLLSELRTEMDSSEDEASSADSFDSTRNTQVTSTPTKILTVYLHYFSPPTSPAHLLSLQTRLASLCESNTSRTNNGKDYEKARSAAENWREVSGSLSPTFHNFAVFPPTGLFSQGEIGLGSFMQVLDSLYFFLSHVVRVTGVWVES
jgi:hypothetical protein